MDSKMRTVQIGVGNFGAYRRKMMRETGLFDLVAAYDLNRDALAQCQQEDGAKPAESYEALLDTPGIEAVIISTGAKHHASQIIRAAERGFHVFVEKPLCSTAEEVETLLEIQRRTGLVIGVGHTDHSRSAVSLKTQELIANGELGTIAAFEKTTAHNGGLLIKPGDWRGDPARNPGGMLFQCGVHAFHELMFYFGRISEISCMMRYDVHTATLTADTAVCNMKFASGLIGTLNAYHVTPYRHAFNIFGTKANLYRNERFFDEGTALQIQRTNLDGRKEPYEKIDISSCPDDPAGNLRSFYDAIRKGGNCYPSIIDGTRAVAAVFAAEESARTGATVKVK